MINKIECKSACRFCEIFEGATCLGKIDRPILKNEKYMALVSVGAFVEGWTLIVPKKHVYSMRNLYNDADFLYVANNLLDKIKEVYHKKCIIFEHGANCEGSITACGTNHAHLHILPYEKSLLTEMFSGEKEWIKCSVEEIQDIVGEKEYWFYSEDVDKIEKAKGFLHIIEEAESQFFRKMIAQKEGCVEQFDYKQYLFLELAEKTYEALRGQYE